MVNINIEKKDLFLLSAIMVFIVGTGIVIAFGSGDPQVHGHDIGEIEGGLTGSIVLINCAWEPSPPGEPGWVNNWDETLDFTCPSGKVLIGAYSVHDNSREDRVWKFQCCEVAMQ